MSTMKRKLILNFSTIYLLGEDKVYTNNFSFKKIFQGSINFQLEQQFNNLDNNSTCSKDKKKWTTGVIIYIYVHAFVLELYLCVLVR